MNKVMRKYIKNQILKTVKTLFEANRLLNKLIKKNSRNKISTLLQDMQAAAIEAGEIIEDHLGEGTETVHFLEELCELIWEVSQFPADGKRQWYKEINEKLSLIEEKVKSIPEKMEVVFLPYKASMWDSLESIWQAADKDKSCEAFVIPIPYYDKNPDGSLKEVHYEAEEYPAYVHITHYNDYNFKQRHPDMIFIHNPYDECNFVTSVHPFFYSSNLLKFTETLVYIPYFILHEILPEDKAAVENMQHFCTVPGVFNADKVIVQSESMRKVYINVLTDAASGLGKNRAYWEKKIWGLGSPKVDKVVNTKRNNLQAPEEWMRMIQKPDGQLKKIILYNTGVDALIKHSDQMLNKIKNVLQIFRESQNEVVLLWRPHPLVKATIKSMRPVLWKEYKSIEDKYRKEGWGIYDDSSDMNRALAISNAYYGDNSSLVRLFLNTGRLVMIQNVEIVNDIQMEEQDVTGN